MTSPVVTVSTNTAVDEIRKLFHLHRFHHLIVVSDAAKLNGIISDRDVLAAKASDDQAKDIMTPHVLTAHPSTRIRAVAAILFEERIGAIPIVGEQGELLGILTRSDILRTVVNHAPLELWM